MIQQRYSLDDLPEIASKIKQNLACQVLLFVGEMGTGKTTLIKALCRSLGVMDEVSSPTFSLVNEYGLENGDSLFHFDLYRINDEEELVNIGIEDYLYSGAICLVEWPDKIASFLPESFGVLKISLSEKGRVLQFTPKCTVQSAPSLLV